jgi:tight adherence protein B
MKQFLIGLGALAVVALIEGLYHSIRFLSERKREELRRRLQSLGGDAPEVGERSLLRQGKLARSPFLDDLLRGVPLLERLEQLVDQAQVSLTVAQLLTLSALAALAGGTVATLAAHPLAGLMVALLAGAAPTLVVLSIRQQRSRKISEQLPDALDMMARSLRAGHALVSAFKLVAAEMPNPVALEFGRAFEEQNLGMSFERAVLQMIKRTPGNRDLRIFAVSVIVQKETGGNLVEILEKIAETIRARYRFFGKLRTLTAEGRISGLVLGLLPIVTAFLVLLTNPTYLSGLVTSRMGQAFLIYAVVSWFLGLVWLRAMAKVEL